MGPVVVLSSISQKSLPMFTPPSGSYLLVTCPQ
jgi:hypothetical protein